MASVESLSSSPPARRSLPHISQYLPLVPPAVVLLFVFAIPMGMMIRLSFRASEGDALTLYHYERFFGDGLMLAGLWRTALMSGLVAICVTVMAYPIAYYLARSRSRWRPVVFALAIAPELAGVVLRTYGWLVILEDHGAINTTLMWAGILTEPLPLSKNLVGVVIGLTHVVLPFGVLSLLTSIQGIDPNFERAAQILGASRLSVIRRIILPLSIPGIVSSLLIAFTISASAYATPALLGGAGFKVLATMVYEQVLFYINWPFAAVMAVVLLVMMLTIAFVGGRFEARLHKKLHI